jgi:hypothetical protein
MSQEEGYVIAKGSIPDTHILHTAKDFLGKFKTHELENGTKHVLLFDKRSKAYYLNCHLDADLLVTKSDLDAVLDPNESEDYKLNRDIYTDTYAYKLMESDALRGRSFEDLVVEYDTTYRHGTPLKVFGGQHRITAIIQAKKKGVSMTHGVRVYFGLTLEQKADIAMANNTSIVVSHDLLDRMQEDLLGTDLRKYCQSVGLLQTGHNFADRRSPEGIPTVRIARTLLVNFYLGENLEKDDQVPVVCASGPGLDGNYESIHGGINWSRPALVRMGKEFSRLHNLQRERVLRRSMDRYLEFANKAIHPCVAASWAYAAGMFQNDEKALTVHYSLPESSREDPLNAKALLAARLKGSDPEKYRGLGSRISSEELGRMLEVFILQATKAKKRGITLALANAAIVSFSAKKAKHSADKALKGI